MTSGSGNNSCLLFITDRISGQCYMVDSSAEVSVLPATHADHQIWKKRLPLRATFIWTFTLADVGQPIIGEDFISDMVYSLTSSTTSCATLKHLAAAFLLTSLTSRHSTSIISLWCQIITTPLSKIFPILLLYKWLIRH